MKSDRICIHCKQEFKNIEGRVFSNHVRWCDKNITNGDKGRENLKTSATKQHEKVLGTIKEFKVECHKCSKSFIVKERDKEFPSKEKYYCSRSCANSRIQTKEMNDKRRKLLIKELPIKICFQCKKEFKSKRSKFCSRECLVDHNRRNLEGLKLYRTKCRFKFSLKDYTEEFDFKLIEQYGWYTAKNRGNNQNGISRDHIISVKFGYENDIDPDIIAHPANCRLMKQQDNFSKGIDCGLTLEELYDRIESWNEKYKCRCDRNW